MLEALGGRRVFSAGADIMRAGERADFFGTVVDGVVKLTRSLPDGRRQMVGLLFPGDFVGHVMRREVDYDASAATEVTMCVYPRAAFQALMADSPGLQARLLALTLNELDAAQEQLLLLGRKSAREKVASFLLALLRRSKDGVSARLPLSRAEIAEYLGLTIETVSRQMTGLREAGVIAFDGQRDIRAPDIERLAAEAGD